MKKAAAKDLDYNIFVQLPGTQYFIFVNDINHAPDKVILFSEWFDSQKQFRCTQHEFSPDFELFYYDPEEQNIKIEKKLIEKVA